MVSRRLDLGSPKLIGRLRARRWVVLALLAALLQIFAPIRAVAAQAPPALEAPICHTDAGTPAPAPAHSHEGFCPACHICCVGVQLALPAVDAAIVPLPAVADLGADSTYSPSMPRGPPQVPPKARAPPRFSS